MVSFFSSPLPLAEVWTSESLTRVVSQNDGGVGKMNKAKGIYAKGATTVHRCCGDVFLLFQHINEPRKEQLTTNSY